ncbi:ferredoxin [Gordonia insulae]|uniref:Ferredoxin n=1 Tax=Gordonia insulae TaxID=2420509 RepID=A0A3G8JLE3_9ACTN|nr:ferredoxin [Gordonia insulae]AZG45907.1 hypothetical protein D7316_02507 [Gordonia insulae]
MKVEVDEHACQGHTLCAMVAPDLFTLRDEDGHSEANNGGEVPRGLEQAANSAISSCPERAIRMIED